MFHLTSVPRRCRWRQNPDPTSGRFEGRDCGSGVSAFIVDAAPGAGPPAHVHRYPETFVASAGIAHTFVDDQTTVNRIRRRD